MALMTLGDPLHSCAHRGHEGDGSFGARGDALTACVALSDPYRVRRHPPMRRTAQLAQGSQHRKISGIDAAYFEHVIRAHVHTFAFGLAAGMINDRSGSHGTRIRMILRIASTRRRSSALSVACTFGSSLTRLSQLLHASLSHKRKRGGSSTEQKHEAN